MTKNEIIKTIKSQQMKKDFEAINKAKAELETALAAAEKDNKNLASKFAKYDIALWGMENPEAAEKTINRAVRHVNRCIEVASGAPVEPKDFYNRQCEQLMEDKFAEAGMPYQAPEETTE